MTCSFAREVLQGLLFQMHSLQTRLDIKMQDLSNFRSSLPLKKGAKSFDQLAILMCRHWSSRWPL